MITSKSKILITDPQLRVAIFEIHKGVCFYTGQNISIKEMSIDHIVPKIHGGNDCIENYVPTTKKLNSIKNGTRHNLLIIVSLEANKALFVDKVVAKYNELLSYNGMIDINQFCNIHKIKNKISFINKCKRVFTFEKHPKIGYRQNKYYFRKQDLKYYLRNNITTVENVEKLAVVGSMKRQVKKSVVSTN